MFARRAAGFLRIIQIIAGQTAAPHSTPAPAEPGPRGAMDQPVPAAWEPWRLLPPQPPATAVAAGAGAGFVGVFGYTCTVCRVYCVWGGAVWLPASGCGRLGVCNYVIVCLPDLPVLLRLVPSHPTPSRSSLMLSRKPV